MTEYLNPTTYNKLKDDVKTFDEIDSTGDYLAYKYGNSDTRLISHKDVAKDMYIKYVLKESMHRAGLMAYINAAYSWGKQGTKMHVELGKKAVKPWGTMGLMLLKTVWRM